MVQLTDLLEQVEKNRKELIDLHRGLVRIPSVNTGTMPTGDETAVCVYVKDWLSEYDIDSHILESTPNRGNIIATLQGKDPFPGLLFMSHTDVVPVENEKKWMFPPFSAEIHENRIYGRGASDCKGLLAAQLMALRLLKTNNVQLRKSLRLVSGADEEHGGRYGFGWLAENHSDLLKSDYAVNEGGGIPIEAAGSLAYLVGTGEKGRLQIEIDIKGESAHASTPWQGKNAMYRLQQVLGRIQQYQPDLDTSSSIFNYLSIFAIEHKPTKDNIEEIISDVLPTNPRLATMLKALSRLTITPTMLSGGIKSNSVPESVRLTCDVRSLPHQNEEYVSEQLDNILDSIEGVSYSIDYMAVPNSSDFETDFSDEVRKATEHVIERNDIGWIPTISTGFTDSRFTRPLGVITYGFMGSHPDDDPMQDRIHGTDESIGISSLVNSTKIMLALAYNMLAK